VKKCFKLINFFCVMCIYFKSISIRKTWYTTFIFYYIFAKVFSTGAHYGLIIPSYTKVKTAIFCNYIIVLQMSFYKLRVSFSFIAQYPICVRSSFCHNMLLNFLRKFKKKTLFASCVVERKLYF